MDERTQKPVFGVTSAVLGVAAFVVAAVTYVSAVRAVSPSGDHGGAGGIGGIFDAIHAMVVGGGLACLAALGAILAGCVGAARKERRPGLAAGGVLLGCVFLAGLLILLARPR